MNANTIGMLIIMIIYLGVMVLIGVLFSRKNNDTSDFYLGGRKLGPPSDLPSELILTGSSLQNVCAAIPTKQTIPLRSRPFLQTAIGTKVIPCWRFQRL